MLYYHVERHSVNLMLVLRLVMTERRMSVHTYSSTTLPVVVVAAVVVFNSGCI